MQKILLGLLFMAASVVAQEQDDIVAIEKDIAREKLIAEGASNTELAKKAQNPIANLISLPFQNNTDFDWGPEEGTRNTEKYNLQDQDWRPGMMQRMKEME
jgi:hypothetical protein